MSPSMVSSMNQKRFFDQDQRLTPSSPMQQQRQDYNMIYNRNGNLAEERDISLTSPNRFGTSMQSHLSPRNRQHTFSGSNNPYPHGDVGQLQGVWNAFDSVTTELGKELHDCLSNKAIFEACVVQEQNHFQGKRMTSAEKNEEASLRKTKYENELTIALNRQKGLFSNAVMTANKEMQNSMDRRIAEVELRFSRQFADMERSYANRLSEREEYFTRQLQTKADDSNREIRRLQNECDQAGSTIQELQNDISIQRQTLTQSLHAAEEGREAAINELTTTLETLKSTCTLAQSNEMKLHEVESNLDEMQTQHQLECNRAAEAWSMENERANLLQQTLDTEVKTNKILRSAQEEMKQLLSDEQERSDLLQNKMQEVEQSLQDTSQKLEHSAQENDELREQAAEVPKLQNALSETIKSLRAAKQKADQLSEEFETCQERLEHSSEMNSMLAGKVSALESQVNDQILDLQAARLSEADVEASLEDYVKKADELTAKLNDSESSLQKKLQDMKELSQQIDSLKRAAVESENIALSLKIERDELKTCMKKLQDECNDERNQIASALEGFDEEMASAASKLRNTRNELEEEREKVKLLGLPLEEATKKMVDEIKLLKEEKESTRVKFEKEASVYNEAIKMLQKQVDLLQEMVDAGENSSGNDRVKELEGLLKEREDEISHLKENCFKREESIVVTEKLLSKTRKDLSSLRQEKKELQLKLQNYVNVNAIAQCDDGTSKAVDDLFGPVIDAAPSMNDIDDMIDKGEKEFHNIVTYVENQIGAGVTSCGEYGVECTLNDPGHLTRRRQIRGKEQDNILLTNSW